MDVAKMSGMALSSAASGSSPSLLREPGLSSSGRQEPAPTGEERAMGVEGVGEVVDRLRSQVQNLQRDLSFSVDDSTGDVIVQVVDGESGKVVRQIPSEEILRLAERLDEMRSLLFETKA